MVKKLIVLLFVVLVVGTGIVYLMPSGDDAGNVLSSLSGAEAPCPYYLELKPGDVQNPDDVIRYCSSIRSYASDLDVFERAAFYEWYFENHGFNVTFAYADDFGADGSHIWLLMRTPKGEVIVVDPSYRAVGSACMVPLDPKYTRYDEEFGDVYQAMGRLGAGRMDWWQNEKACQVSEENVLVTQKEGAMRGVAG